MPLLFENQRWNAALEGPTPHDSIEATAYKAIRRNLESMTHVDLPAEAGLPVRIRVGSRWEKTLPAPTAPVSAVGYRIRIDETSITLVGGSPKGTLNAAYELLERLGLGWPLSRPDGSLDSPATRLEIDECDDVMEPSFPRLTFFQDLRTLRDYADPDPATAQQQNDRDLVRWMGRHRFTGLYGNLPDWTEPWQHTGRLGIARQAGGHILPRFLPREHFETDPDFFPMNEEGRRFPGNLCSSSPEAVRVVYEAARRYVDETSADVLHLWGEDVLDGKWCECPECRAMTVQDQYLRVANAVADHLSGSHPSLKVAFIAYHDTLAPRLTLKPHASVILLFAPRQRCYRHGLADLGCARNAAIYAGLLEYRAIFGPGRIHTFEYYGDALLWCSAAIVLPRLIIDDLKAYHAAGVVDSGCLMFGGYSWFSNPLNLYAFARASWDLSRTAEEIVAEFTGHLFPGAESAMQRYFFQLEDASRLLVERNDWFYRVPDDPKEAARLLAETEEAGDAWEALPGALSEAMASARPRAGEQLIRVRQALRFSRHLVAAYRRRIAAAARAGRSKAARAEERRTLQEAEGEILSALQLLHDLSPFERGSWGAAGHGEPRRLARLLDEKIRPRIAELGS